MHVVRSDVPLISLRAVGNSSEGMRDRERSRNDRSFGDPPELDAPRFLCRGFGSRPGGIGGFCGMCYSPRMSAQNSDDGQRRDALLRRLLKTPPLSRAETAEAIRQAKGKPTRTQPKRASRKRANAAVR